VEGWFTDDMCGSHSSFLRFGLAMGKLTRADGLAVSFTKRTLSGLVLFRSGTRNSVCSRLENGVCKLRKTNKGMFRRVALVTRMLTSSTRTTMSGTARRKGDNNMRVAYYMAAVAVMVFGVSYASVPLYKGVYSYNLLLYIVSQSLIQFSAR
jgi:hypothetical protein